MSEMIDRLETAIGEATDWAMPPHMNIAAARAAIEAMREPTDEMKAVEGVHWSYSCPVCGGLKEGWQAMIEAALGKERKLTQKEIFERQQYPDAKPQ